MMVACRHLSDTGGIPAEIPGTFWNHYLRGRAYAAVGNWAAAARDFETATGRTPGIFDTHDQDTRRARKYGMRYLHDYFPHRELGVCYFRLGRLVDAEQSLLNSLGMIPTARTEDYLNRVRRAQLQQRTDIRSDAIEIETDLPEAEPWYTNQTEIAVNGTVSSPYRIDRLAINGARQFIQLAEETVAIDERVTLMPGPAAVIIEARDLAGNTIRVEHSVIVDLAAPAVYVSMGPSDDHITLTVADNFALADVQLDGVGQDIKAGTVSVGISLTPARTIRLDATDSAGNRTRWKRSTSALKKASLRTRSLRRNRDRAEVTVRNNPRIVVADVAPVGPKVVRDTMPPSIQLKPEIEEGGVRHTTEHVFDIIATVKDPGMIAGLYYSVTHQGNTAVQPVTLDVERLTDYTKPLPLQLGLGVNDILICAVDRTGNEQSRSFKIHRHLPPDQDHRYRINLDTIIVLADEEIARTDDVSRSLRTPINRQRRQHTIRLRSGQHDLNALMRQHLLSGEPRRFNVLARDGAVFDRIVQEHLISGSHLVDEYLNTVNRNRLRTADWLLAGHVSVFSGSEFTLQLELIDIESRDVIESVSVSMSHDTVAAVTEGITEAVSRLARQLPVLAGTVTDVRHDRIGISLGREHQVILNTRVLFGRTVSDRFDPLPWQRNPCSGGAPCWIQGKVNNVESGGSWTEIRPDSEIDTIKKGDRVIIR